MESEACKYCGMSGAHSPECPTGWEEHVNKERAFKDVKKIEGGKLVEDNIEVFEKGGAEYKEDEGAMRPRLEFTKEQIEKAKLQMMKELPKKREKEISRSEKIIFTLKSLDKANLDYIESIKQALEVDDSDENKSLLLKQEREGELYRSLINDFGGDDQVTKTPSEVAMDIETAIENTLRIIRTVKSDKKRTYSEEFLKFLEDKKELLQDFTKKA